MTFEHSGMVMKILTLSSLLLSCNSPWSTIIFLAKPSIGLFTYRECDDEKSLLGGQVEVFRPQISSCSFGENLEGKPGSIIQCHHDIISTLMTSQNVWTIVSVWVREPRLNNLVSRRTHRATKASSVVIAAPHHKWILTGFLSKLSPKLWVG